MNNTKVIPLKISIEFNLTSQAYFKHEWEMCVLIEKLKSFIKGQISG